VIEVELRDLGTRDVAGVLDGERNLPGGAVQPESGGAAWRRRGRVSRCPVGLGGAVAVGAVDGGDAQVAVIERSVAETKAKLEARLNASLDSREEG